MFLSKNLEQLRREERYQSSVRPADGHDKQPVQDLIPWGAKRPLRSPDWLQTAEALASSTCS